MVSLHVVLPIKEMTCQLSGFLTRDSNFSSHYGPVNNPMCACDCVCTYLYVLVCVDITSMLCRCECLQTLTSMKQNNSISSECEVFHFKTPKKRFTSLTLRVVEKLWMFFDCQHQRTRNALKK